MSAPQTAGTLGVFLLIGSSVLGVKLLYFDNIDYLVLKTEYKGKCSDKYRDYFVDGSEETIKVNKYWWNRSYEDRFIKDRAHDPDERFRRANGGVYGTNSIRSLCNGAYRAETTSVVADKNEANEYKYWEEDVWRYCSIGGYKPQLLADTAYSGRLGNEHKGKAVVIDGTRNEWFWNLKQKEFKTTNKSDIQSDLFKTGNRYVKENCWIAYDFLTTAEDKEKVNKDIKRFCYLIKEQ